MTTRLPCNCGVSKGLRGDHEGECQAAYLRPNRNPRFLTAEQMEKLTTKRLLAYKTSLYRVPEGPSHEETMYGGTDFTMHKKRSEWKTALAEAKAALAERENL